MSGFIGIVDPGGTTDSDLRDITQVLFHRGPDDLGLLGFDSDSRQFIDLTAPPPVRRRYPSGMGFRRLSILDTSYNGHQPMLSRDGRYAVVFNGEIYNYRELRSELLVNGCHFRSETDTEVLPYLYERYGPELLARLNGMFAFAILDRDTPLLFLARDRLGVKPLYCYI
jgi:asparagine synthase (glutamine-hydrolysing)